MSVYSIERVKKMRVTGKYTNVKENNFESENCNNSYKNVYINDYKTLNVYLKFLKERKKKLNNKDINNKDIDITINYELYNIIIFEQVLFKATKAFIKGILKLIEEGNDYGISLTLYIKEKKDQTPYECLKEYFNYKLLLQSKVIAYIPSNYFLDSKNILKVSEKKLIDLINEYVPYLEKIKLFDLVIKESINKECILLAKSLLKKAKENYKKFISEDEVCLYILKLDKDRVLYAESYSLALKLLASIFEENKRNNNGEKKTCSVEKKIAHSKNCESQKKSTMKNTGFCIFDNALNIVYLKLND